MKKKIGFALFMAIGMIMLIMIYVGFRALWFADNATEFIIGIVTMFGFGSGIMVYTLNSDRILDAIENEEE